MAPNETATQPLVSVIMPAFNAAPYLSEAIQSVLDQTWQNWELIIIDDGSTDDTPSICARYTDTRIKYVRTSNRGVSCARNEGLGLATGEFVTFLDADDRLPPDSLRARAAHLLTHPPTHLVAGAISVRSADMVQEQNRHNPSYCGPLLDRLVRLDSRIFFNVCYFFRAAVAQSIRFRAGMTHAEDILYYLEMAHQTGVRMDSITDEVYWYRNGHNSAMSDLTGLEAGYTQLVTAVWRLRDIPMLGRCGLRARVARTMFLCWLRQGRFARAIRSAWRLLIPREAIVAMPAPCSQELRKR